MLILCWGLLIRRERERERTVRNDKPAWKTSLDTVCGPFRNKWSPASWTTPTFLCTLKLLYLIGIEGDIAEKSVQGECQNCAPPCLTSLTRSTGRERAVFHLEITI
ncbi:hypothetical protein AVEN_29343-1 [Araneus ventricosus]|uniref:Uncharacterized protein n=1 Tax=Araneus ventricosus TaxID=182803 RepID=A0A4Y2IXB0_ARAVE|nr:hypothetical protein AVEN_29343-1 [Araneus ventricosus]